LRAAKVTAAVNELARAVGEHEFPGEAFPIYYAGQEVVCRFNGALSGLTVRGHHFGRVGEPSPLSR
jgi:hypothetical protein